MNTEINSNKKDASFEKAADVKNINTANNSNNEAPKETGKTKSPNGEGFKISPGFIIKIIIWGGVLAFLFSNAYKFFSAISEASAEDGELALSYLAVPIFFISVILVLLTFLRSVRTSFGKKIKFRFKTKLRKWLFWSILVVVNSIISFWITECMNNYYIFDMGTIYVILNIFINFLFYTIFVFITNSITVGMLIGNIFLFTWAVINYYVYLFRSTPFQFIDLYSMDTGMSVMNGYDIHLPWQIVYSIVWLLCICSFWLQAGKYHVFKKIKGKIGLRIASILVALASYGLFIRTDFLSSTGIWLRDWHPQYTYRLFGMEAGFLAFAKATVPEKPEGYSQSKVEEIIADYEANPYDETTTSATGSSSENSSASSSSSANSSADNLTENKTTTSSEELVKPDNIIVIMNESFSDLASTYDNVKTDVNYLEFFNSLTENTQRGTLLVSVKGGKTANSEYEFLTGNSMVLTPNNVAYNTLIKNDQYSIARTLKAQGYDTIAVHPYLKNGWNRTIIYKYMGFDQFLSIEDFTNVKKVRTLVSDETDFNKLLDLMEKSDNPLFLFNITIQNHGGYNLDYPSTVHLEGYDDPEVEQYLTLINETDSAFEAFINKLKESDEKTLVLMFGDHQPSMSTDFVNYALGCDVATADLATQQKQYETPFIIWANYDIPEKTDMVMSPNYLGSYLLSLTGLDTTEYEDYLLKQQQIIPAMNAFGYYDADGNMNSYDLTDGSDDSNTILNYECLIYNELFGGNKRNKNFFGLLTS